MFSGPDRRGRFAPQGGGSPAPAESRTQGDCRQNGTDCNPRQRHAVRGCGFGIRKKEVHDGYEQAHTEIAGGASGRAGGVDRYGHVEVDGEHLLLALLAQPDGLIPRILARMEIDVEGLMRVWSANSAEGPGRPEVPRNLERYT